MQPALPPKPHQELQKPLPLERQLDDLELNDDSTDRTDLPFKSIPPDFTLRLFTRRQGNSLNVPLPSYFEYVSNSKIKELIHNEELLSGYLLSLYKEEFIDLKKELDTVIESQNCAALHLTSKYEEPDSGLLKKLEDLDTELKKYNAKLDNFDHLQIEMYDTLSGLSRKSISKHFSDKAAQNEAKCSDLLNIGSANEDMLSGKELEQLLQEYTMQRYEWHRNKEWASKIEHYKVTGLE